MNLSVHYVSEVRVEKMLHNEGKADEFCTTRFYITTKDANSEVEVTLFSPKPLTILEPKS